MDELGVYRTPHYFAVVLSEGLGQVAELHDLGGADESEVQRIEEQQHPLPFVLTQRNLPKLIGGRQPGVGLEVRGCFANNSSEGSAGHMIC